MKKEETKYVKRTQKDYLMSFKLQVVSEVERGELSTTGAIRKYGFQPFVSRDFELVFNQNGFSIA